MENNSLNSSLPENATNIRERKNLCKFFPSMILKNHLKQLDKERIIDGKSQIIIYLLKNKINNKIYIGQTKRSLYLRWKEHVTVFHLTKIHRAIQKYGQDVFEISIIDKSFSADYINQREEYWISLYNTTNDNFGYNIQNGGDNYSYSIQRRIELSKYFIKCVETNEVFISLKDAAKSKSVSFGNIYQAVEKRPSFNRIGGFTWEKVEKNNFPIDQLVTDIIITKNPKTKSIRLKFKKVKCLETGKIWNKIELLAKELNMSKHTYLNKSIIKKRMFRGFTYQYI